MIPILKAETILSMALLTAFGLFWFSMGLIIGLYVRM
jgi:hypothetical protein